MPFLYLLSYYKSIINYETELFRIFNVSIETSNIIYILTKYFKRVLFVCHQFKIMIPVLQKFFIRSQDLGKNISYFTEKLHKCIYLQISYSILFPQVYQLFSQVIHRLIKRSKWIHF